MLDTMRGMCVFNTRVLRFNARACSIDTMSHGVNRYTPVDFSLALCGCGADVARLRGGFSGPSTSPLVIGDLSISSTAAYARVHVFPRLAGR